MINLNKIIIRIKDLIKFYFLPNSKLTKDVINLLKINQINVPVIFDVGAYQGNFIKNYLKSFPKAYGFLFEPYISSYEYLVNKYKCNERLLIYNCALSSKNGNFEVNINTKTYTNSLLELDPLASESWKNDELKHKEKIAVEVKTLDNFFLNTSVKKKRINLLKLDVQGLESEVLKGSFNLLTSELIDIIVIEMLVAPTYKSQSKLSEIFRTFEDCNYILYGIYDIEKASKNDKIQQFDAVFTKSDFKLT